MLSQLVKVPSQLAGESAESAGESTESASESAESAPPHGKTSSEDVSPGHLHDVVWELPRTPPCPRLCHARLLGQ